MKILYWQGNPQDASKHVRILEPLKSLSRRGHTLIPVDEWELKVRTTTPLPDFDLLLLSNVDITSERQAFFRSLKRLCKARQRPIIHDFDDLYHEVPEGNPHRNKTLPWEIIRETLSECDAITVTGRELQNVFSRFHPEVHLLPNMIDFSHYPVRQPTRGRLRIGWAGGATHLLDLSMVSDAIRDLQQRHDFDFVIFGMFAEYTRLVEVVQEKQITPDQFDGAFEKDLVTFIRSLEGIRFEIHPVVAYADFPTRLVDLNLDMGLCPIQDTLFNRCRSPLKYYQYAAANMLTIASRVYPYTDEPLPLAENSRPSWVNTIEPFLLDESLRKSERERQQSHVRQTRDVMRHIDARENFYKSWIERLKAR